MHVVMGVTGKVGGAVARALLAEGLPVRAVVRDAAKARAWAEAGCELAVADLDNAPALTVAFAGAEAAFAMLPPLFDPSPDYPEAKAMIATVCTALAAAAPGRVVALSTVGADVERPNLLNQLRLLEQSLAALPMSVAFLRAAWFMENAAGDLASARDSGVIQSYLQPLDRPIPMVSSEDVGRTAAAMLQERWDGARVVELEGERVSAERLAGAFSQALGKPVRAEAVPRADWEAIFRAQGMRNPAPRIRMIDGFNEGWIDFADQGRRARKGAVSVDEAIARLARD
jgi:uncharacterized protein YbjT (DUF2867 family)